MQAKLLKYFPLLVAQRCDLLKQRLSKYKSEIGIYSLSMALPWCGPELVSMLVPEAGICLGKATFFTHWLLPLLSHALSEHPCSAPSLRVGFLAEERVSASLCLPLRPCIGI